MSFQNVLKMLHKLGEGQLSEAVQESRSGTLAKREENKEFFASLSPVTANSNAQDLFHCLSMGRSDNT